MTSRTRGAPRATALAAAVVLLAATPAAADDKPWTAAPAPPGRAAPGAEDRTAFYLEGGPGTVFEDKLTVVNLSARARTLDVRATGPWIALAARHVRVPPRTRADIPLTVTVPGGAPAGDHPGTLVVSGDGRQARVRLAVRVTGGPALRALTVENVRVERAGTGAVIRYALVNRGNTALAPHLTIRADGLLGTVWRRTASGVPAELPPGRSLRLSERWPDAPRLDRVDVLVTASAPGAARASASGSYAPLPWVLPALGGLGLALVAAAGLLVRRHSRRSRRRRAGSPSPRPLTPAPEAPA
ncbi:hypothetical protein [Streptomyces sp. ISL-11]|uniref:COG1470 family protein n=1 Tax=Streptomyces sp. ISL-11 TaxID=2819174 RepID=UPI001BE96EED|nr:hypothetical protein [Streptomyces sp. ISL-11]MBT2385793.1 hypothetical protein [Streptomyces sp. ISL-11]